MRDFTTVVDRNELLDILRENRAAHVKVVKDALAVYKRKWIVLLKNTIIEIEQEDEVPSRLHLPPPVDNTAEYDRAIEMVKMHTRKTVELDETRFANWVQDQWLWSDNFHATNSIYTTTTKR